MQKVLVVPFLLLNTFIFCQTVNTQFGQIEGIQNGNVYQFLGVPFAKPPVNDLRWKAPEDPEVWTGTLNTTTYAPVCPQKKFEQGGGGDTIIGNEDCLYLNIWTPQVGAGSRPVMVFIHGGGNQQGSASEESAGTQIYFGENLSDRGDAVVVTIQYRLGPLGFLVHPGLEPENVNNVSGNYAVMDQILALTWVKNNIANFGGDPNKVMIFGESAGGINVGNLLLTPLANNLFQRACIQSATPVLGDYNTTRADGVTYVDGFTSTGTDIDKITFMRTVSSDDLVADEEAPLSGGAVGLNWLPVIDDIVFEDIPYNLFSSGNFNHVPLIVGSNSEEMSLSVPSTVTPGMVTALKLSIFPSGLMSQANLLYPSGSTNEEARVSYIGILTDSQFTSTSKRTAQCVSENQTEPVWRYFFTHKHTIAALEPLGSYHGMELFYVFNNWENATLGSGGLFHTEDGNVQDAMLQYWVNFANTGNPNESGLEAWPQYAGNTDCYLEIKSPPNGTQCGLRTAESDLWDDLVNYVPCSSSLSISEMGNGSFTLFPNPTDDYLMIIAQNVSSDFETTVIDFTGKHILTSRNQGMDLSGLSAGIYVIEIRQNNFVWQTKVVKK